MGEKKTVWSLGLEIAGKDTGAGKALMDIQKQMKNVQAAGKQLGADFKNFTQNATKLVAGVAGGAAAATAAIVAAANSFANTGMAIQKTAGAVGMGVEAYQQMQYAMTRSGLSAGEFDSALEKFNLTVRQGAAGNEAAAKQLTEIGLSAKKLAGMKPEQAMERLSDYMKKLPSDAERTRVAVTLFGKAAGPQMMQAMKEGSAGLKELMKASEKYFTFTEENIKQSREYQNAQNDLKESVGSLKNQFISGAMGPLTEAFKTLTGAVLDNMPAIKELGAKFGQWLGDLVKRLPEVIGKIKEFGAWVKETATRVVDFVGGFKNLAKIIAGLAIAPTAISGLKVMFSLGNLVQVTMKNLPGIIAKIAPAFGGVSVAALPIIGIIAGIAAAAFLIVKNWDKVKPAVINAVNTIKDTIGKAIENLKAWWGEHGDTVIAAINKIADVITGVFTVAWNVLSTAIGVAADVISGFIGFVSDCVDWLSEHKTVLGFVAIAVGTVTAAIIAYNAAQAIANAGGIVAVVRMGAQAIATGVLSAATGVWATVAGIGTAATTAFGAAMAFLTSPITLVILLIGAVVAAAYLIIKNWEAISEFFKGLWENIKNIFSGIGSWFSDKFNAAKEAIINIFSGIGDFFSGVWGGIKNAAGKAWDGIKGAASNAWEGIKSGASKTGEFLKSNWKTIAIGMVSPWAGGLKALYDHNEKFRNFIDTTWGKIKDIAGAVWDKMPDGVKDVFIKIKDIISGAINGIKNFFSGLWGAIKEGPAATIDYLKNAFFGLFDALKQKIETFVNFFKEKMEAVKNFFGGIGDKVGGVVGGAVDKFKSFLPGHAEGGIFTHRHIAEIAERGAEAVVPLNNSPQGFDIWKQAGELGGYADRMNQQTATSSTNGTPPVMQAAAQRISGGENVININFSQNNTFNGGTPDKETVNQIAAAGQEAADDFEARVKQAFDNILRNQARVSYA